MQRIENMASDIAVGIVVQAAAKKNDRVKREEQARQREEERRLLLGTICRRVIRPEACRNWLTREMP